MEIKSVTLKNFRNYSDSKFDFTSGLNVLEGRNTVGKTNVVESVYFCAFGKSPRTNKDAECVKWGEKTAEIHLKFSKKYRDYSIDFLLSQNGEKRIASNGASISKISQLIGLLNVIYFSPDELRMIKEGPAERRKFMDISLSQQNKKYFYSLSKYTQVLKNRNKLLKDGKSLDYLKSTLPVWDVSLVESGVDLIQKRLEFLKNLNPIVDDIHRSIAGNDIGLEIEYESEIDLSNAKSYFADNLVANYEKDQKLGYTSVGPHRDDLLIKSNGIDIRKFGSQGQQRTASLAIKLAEAICLEEYTGEKPVLILDDVLSELDPLRRQALLTKTKDLQVLLTCTDFTEESNFIKNLIKLS